MSAGFWQQKYWHGNYWQANYWTPTGSANGNFWNTNYWHANYWQTDYWAESADDIGDVTQTDPPVLSFAPQIPTVTISLNVEPPTALLPITALQADANLDIDPPLTTPTLALTSLNPNVAFEGYQLGDIDLRWVPNSTITISYVVLANAPTLGFTVMSHTIEEGGGVNVATSLPSLSLTALNSNARLDIAVEPLPPTLGWTPLNTTAGIGNQIPATLPTLSFSVATHTIVATSVGGGDANATVPTLALQALNPTVVGNKDVFEGSGDAHVKGKRPADLGVCGKF